MYPSFTRHCMCFTRPSSVSVLLAANAGVRRPGNEANRNDLVGENQIVPMFDLGSCHPQILTFDLLWSNPSFTIYCGILLCSTPLNLSELFLQWILIAVFRCKISLSAVHLSETIVVSCKTVLEGETSSKQDSCRAKHTKTKTSRTGGESNCLNSHVAACGISQSLLSWRNHILVFVISLSYYVLINKFFTIIILQPCNTFLFCKS